MDALGDLAHGFEVALTPENLLWALIGVLLGTAVGVLPGIGPALTVALLLPVTYKLEPVSAFIMFAGIYYGGMYGGSTTSILLNTPGESASIVTALEGNKMAKRGRGAAALATAAIGSFVAGTVGTIGLTFLAPVMVQIGLKFGPAEYFALVVLAFTTITALLGGSVARGLLSLFFGLALGLVGIDTLSGQSRFTFGIPQLLDGIDVVTVAVGLFAVGETFWVASRMRHDPDQIIPVKGTVWMTRAGVGPLLETVAAGDGARLPHRQPAGRRRRDPDLPLLRDGEAALQAPGGVRAGRHRGGCRTRGGEQRLRRRRAGAAADPGAADLGDGGDPARRLPALRAQPGTDPLPLRPRPRLGTHRQSLHRQRDAAGPQPAAGRVSGCGCWPSRGRCSTPRILVFAGSGHLRAQRLDGRSGRALPAGGARASSCAASTSRSRRRSSA